jgi:dTDP-4-amino-4,6-dideoxygalactose transaminase
LPIVKPYQDRDSYSALHLYPIQIDLDSVDKSRQQVFDELRQDGVGVNVHYIPIHTQPHYQELGFKEGNFPNSEVYYSRAISIPLFHAMTLDQQDQVVATLKKIL